MAKSNTRVTVDIPTVDHKRLKILAAYQGKSMREIFIELIERGLEDYKKCPRDHIPNEVTKKALKNVDGRKGLQQIDNIDELFKKLGE